MLDGLGRQSHYGTEEFNLNAENLQLDFLNGTLPVWRHNITKLNWNGDYTRISYHCMCRQLEGRILRKSSRKPLQWRDLQGKLVKPGALFSLLLLVSLRLWCSAAIVIRDHLYHHYKWFHFIISLQVSNYSPEDH